MYQNLFTIINTPSNWFIYLRKVNEGVGKGRNSEGEGERRNKEEDGLASRVRNRRDKVLYWVSKVYADASNVTTKAKLKRTNSSALFMFISSRKTVSSFF